MAFVYIGIIIILFWHIKKNSGKENNLSILENKKYICILIGVILFLISAFKAISFNNGSGDLLNYYDRYTWLSSQSYNSLWLMYISGTLKDFGFYFIAKVFVDLGFSAYVWMGMIALLFAISTSYFIFKFSTKPKISFIILIAVYFSFTLTGLRQTFALVFIIFAYKYLLERKLIQYLLLVIIAGFFHSSAWIFIPAYIFTKFKFGWKHLIIIAFGLVVSLFFPSLFRSLINIFAWNDSLESYGQSTTMLSWSGYIIQFIIYVFCIFFRRYCARDKKEMLRVIDPLLSCMTIGLFFQGFANIVAESFRISYYYSIGSIIVIPNIISTNQSIENRKILVCLITCAFIVYMLWSGAYRDLIYIWQV